MGTLLFVPGSCDSLGDLSRKLAAAHGRDWGQIPLAECDAWLARSAALVAGLVMRDRMRVGAEGLS
jgi:hypothetical protein